jgi:hypothetical protein
VGVVVGVVVAARRGGAERRPRGAPSHCLYCGRALPEGAARCDDCGFRVKEDG